MPLDSYLFSRITGLIHLLSTAPDRADSWGGGNLLCLRDGVGEKGGLLAVAEATLEHRGLQCPLCLPEKIALGRSQFSADRLGFSRSGRPCPTAPSGDNRRLPWKGAVQLWVSLLLGLRALSAARLRQGGRVPREVGLGNSLQVGLACRSKA